jgi:hypothetical protein
MLSCFRFKRTQMVTRNEYHATFKRNDWRRYVRDEREQLRIVRCGPTAADDPSKTGYHVVGGVADGRGREFSSGAGRTAVGGAGGSDDRWKGERDGSVSGQGRRPDGESCARGAHVFTVSGCEGVTRCASFRTLAFRLLHRFYAGRVVMCSSYRFRWANNVRTWYAPRDPQPRAITCRSEHERMRIVFLSSVFRAGRARDLTRWLRNDCFPSTLFSDPTPPGRSFFRLAEKRKHYVCSPPTRANITFENTYR